MDGLEWDVLEPLLDKGRLPNFEKLIQRGIGGSIQTAVPTFSPVLWSTIATGFGPQEHGILNFAEMGADGQLGKPYTSNTRRVPAIWNMAAEQNRRVLSTAWWVSWPAEAISNGRIVASYAAQAQGRILWKSGVWKDGLPDLTYPNELIEEILPALQNGAPEGPLRKEFNSVFGSIPQGGDWDFPWQRDRLFRVAYHGDRTHHRIMLEQLQKEVADLNMVYYGLPDVSGHYFWRYREPSAFSYFIPEEQIARLGDRIDRVYEVMDRWLGELLEAVPEDTHILILSDHGMHAFNLANPRQIQSGGHEDGPDGVFIFAGPSAKQTGLLPKEERRVTNIFQIAPALLHLLNLPVPEDMPAPVPSQLFTNDWSSSHPVEKGPSLRPGFRKATPPRIPGKGYDKEFIDSMRAIGYVGGEEEEE
jgi:hypothetical protein